jgi:hypothetical protein
LYNRVDALLKDHPYGLQRAHIIGQFCVYRNDGTDAEKWMHSEKFGDRLHVALFGNA